MLKFYVFGAHCIHFFLAFHLLGIVAKYFFTSLFLGKRVQLIDLAASFPTFTPMSGINLDNWQQKSAENTKKYKHFLQKEDKKNVLKQLPDLHEEAFSKIDCLTCAACCKNYSPRFKTPDLKRISKHLKLKESVFIDTYLNLDSDGDYVVKTAPCPFLGSDNYCSIYDQRPRDCYRFPYTDDDVLLKRPAITLKNATFCPAVYYVLEKLI